MPKKKKKAPKRKGNARFKKVFKHNVSMHVYKLKKAKKKKK